MANTTAYAELSKDLDVEPGMGRTASDQASYQAVAIAHTLAIACVGGAITGNLINELNFFSLSIFCGHLLTASFL